jgi:hypothetical protein
MPADLAHGLLDILGTTLEPDRPVDPADNPNPWATEMTLDGSWAPDLSTGHEPVDIDDDHPWELPLSLDAEDPTERSGLDDPDDEPEALEASDPEESQERHLPAADGSAARALLRIEHSDPDLDDDLALWHTATTPTRPLVAILGPPDMHAPGPRPARRLPWLLEVAVYLALHPHGVTSDKISTDLWPEGQNVSASTIRRAIADTRLWAGHHPDDPARGFIPPISPSGGIPYRLTGHLLDWDLFRRLRKRGQARAAAGHTSDAITDYRAALGLVRGPVLRPLRERGYAWLHNPDQHHDTFIPGFVIDTAHELINLALAEEDLELARQTAETAKVVDPDRTHDRPFLDLMRIAHAEGNLAEMRDHAELLLAERGFEVGEDLPPESFAVFDELFPRGLPASGGR